jgi:hypothetical protein
MYEIPSTSANDEKSLFYIKVKLFTLAGSFLRGFLKQKGQLA